MFRALLLAVTICIAAGTASAENVKGPAGITDGDTLRISNVRIRFFGIDAPEKNQVCLTADESAYDCGHDSALALADYIGGRDVMCDVKDVDRYGRLVSVCFVGDVDLNALMVINGWAVASRKYSMDYVDEEEVARSARLGLWAGTFDMPWEWRKLH